MPTLGVVLGRAPAYLATVRFGMAFSLRTATMICCAFGVIILMSTCNRMQLASVAGKYVNEKNPDNYIELKADGTYYSQSRWGGSTGTYEIEGDQITIKLASGAAGRATIRDNTITDGDERWVKSK